MGQWLTPDNIPPSSMRVVLLIPDDSEWLAVISGVLLDLTNAANWEQYGALTPQETADKWLETLESWFTREVCP